MDELNVFKAPEGLARELVEFFDHQRTHPMTELGERRSALIQYTGVYALYYTGEHPLYRSIKATNDEGTSLPIYVGKAVPRGARTGVIKEEGKTASPSANLYARLREHRNSIDQVENFSLEDFQFRVVAMEVNLVSWGEALLIGHFQPPWNQVISGFGIHDPGGGRAEQQRSVWDRLHPGRTAARRLPEASSVDEREYVDLIEELSRRTRKRLTG